VRRESSTVVALVGSARPAGGRAGSSGVTPGPAGAGSPGRARSAAPSASQSAAAEPAGPFPAPLLAELGGSANIAVVRPPAADTDAVTAGAAALSQAARRSSPFALVLADPLADVGAAWQAMWDLAGGMTGTALFEERAARALAAWRARQFELPDYYLVLADVLGGAARAAATTAGPAAVPTGGADPGAGGATGPEFYLGPLRAARPNRVVVVSSAGGTAGQAAEIRDALRSLPHGRWWPPLDEVLDVARRFYAGGLAEAGTTLASAPR
jgi:hypothetical protein